MAPAPRPAFWEILVRFEKHKINPWIALRNALGIALPLAVGAAMGRAGSGLIMTTGALNVALSDGSDPYLHRARRMLAASCCCSLAVLAGGFVSQNHIAATVVAAACAFAAGMMVAVDQVVADLGTVTLVTFLVFSAQAMTPRQALVAASLALAGGLLQTAFSLALWPLRRYVPERHALSDLYAELGRAAAAGAPATEAPPASVESNAAQAALISLGGDRSVPAERYLALLSQAERMRLALLTLARLRVRTRRENPEGMAVATLDRALAMASVHLSAIGASLRTGEPPLISGEFAPLAAELNGDTRSQVETLAGQLRSAAHLAADATPAGSALFEQHEAEQPWRLRFAGAVAALRANLNFDSTALRHSLRLAACVAAGDVLGRALDPRRGYWVTMTIAIVLKPDFTSTFTRGLLRLAGTFAGLGLATLLFHWVAPGLAVQVTLIGILAFLLRCFGPANYGVFVTALTALVVVMFAVIGVAPSPVIASRAINTVAGGAIAFAGYLLWPTWERGQVSETLARMLDGYREYFHWVREAHLNPAAQESPELHRARLAGRLARSNLEASIARLRAEPRVPRDHLSALDAIMANSHRFIHAVMSLEGALVQRRDAIPAEPFRAFADDVEATLQVLADVRRGSASPNTGVPDLRQDYQTLIASSAPASLFAVETDRITNSLNTLAEEILRSGGEAAGRQASHGGAPVR